jgi:hypothetical protein
MDAAPVNDRLDTGGERNIVGASHGTPAGDLTEIGNTIRPLGAGGHRKNENLRFDSDLLFGSAS